MYNNGVMVHKGLKESGLLSFSFQPDHFGASPAFLALIVEALESKFIVKTFARPAGNEEKITSLGRRVAARHYQTQDLRIFKVRLLQLFSRLNRRLDEMRLRM